MEIYYTLAIILYLLCVVIVIDDLRKLGDIRCAKFLLVLIIWWVCAPFVIISNIIKGKNFIVFKKYK